MARGSVGIVKPGTPEVCGQGGTIHRAMGMTGTVVKCWKEERAMLEEAFRLFGRNVYLSAAAGKQKEFRIKFDIWKNTSALRVLIRLPRSENGCLFRMGI